MQQQSAGVTKAATGIDGISWNILGQTYVPKQLSEGSSPGMRLSPVGTFVPPHIHPTQDEYIYMLEGRFDLVLDGREYRRHRRRPDPAADEYSARHLQQDRSGREVHVLGDADPQAL